VNKVQECLQLPLETMDILILSYVFTTQSKEKSQELREQGRVYASLKPIGRVIDILCHLTSSIGRMNLAFKKINIDPIYIELDSWDVCTNFKEIRSTL
jgi:hypothetical protein